MQKAAMHILKSAIRTLWSALNYTLCVPSYYRKVRTQMKLYIKFIANMQQKIYSLPSLSHHQITITSGV